MKTLYLIGGPMGVGKTSVSRALQKLLPDNVFLDGDWCWDMEPFTVTGETKAMVLDNICHVLNNFLRCSAFQNVIFCWVMHRQEILDGILSRLDKTGWQVVAESLVCSPEALEDRIRKDVAAGLRQPDVIARSLERLEQYGELNTKNLDTTDMTPEQTAKIVAGL